MNKLITEIRSEMLAELRSEMNGAVVESMRQYNGSEPFFSYGVSLPRIKQEALKHKGNHELALLLFSSDIRELKLAAIYVDTPQAVTPEQMKTWSSSFHSSEIADNAATMLFYGAPEALTTAAQWLRTEELTRSALMMIGKRARSQYDEKEYEEYRTLLDKIIPMTRAEHSRNIMDGISYALTSLHKLFPEEVESVMSDEKTQPYIAATIMV